MVDSQIRVAALDHYRRLVSLVYREIGVLRASHHPLAAKAKVKDPLFRNETRKSRARDIYRMTLSEEDPMRIATAYESRSGLSLTDLYEAFLNGKWGNRFGGYSYGGPRWARITETALQLGTALQNGSGSELSQVIGAVLTLEHNNGRITEKYSQLD